MATLLAEKMFRNCNSSFLRQQTVSQPFFVFYRVQYGLLRYQLIRTFSVA